MQIQDSKQPQANGEFLSQLAQFSNNAGINTLQNSLQELVSSLQSNQALQASALVGRKVLIAHKSVPLGPFGEVLVAVDVPEAFSDLRALIKDRTGNLIKTIRLASPTSGLYQFSWDGRGIDNVRQAAGAYIVEVYGMSKAEEIVLKTMIFANVDSVNLGKSGEGLILNVSGIGPVSLDQVRHISLY